MLEGPGVLTRHALLHATPDGQLAVRRAVDQAEILINGVRLGAQPTPLLHGDKVEIAGQELLFVDERRSGSTQYIQAVDAGALASPAGESAAPAAGTRATVWLLTTEV